MKLSKVTFLFLVIGIVIIAGASLGMTHSRQVSQQNQLEQQIKSAQQKLSSIDISKISAQQNQLEQEQSTYQSQLDSIKTKLTSSTDSISATEELLNTGPTFKVQVTTLDSPGTSSGTLVNTNCNILTLNIQVDGTLPNIKAYISNISQIFPTSIVTSVQMTSKTQQNQASGDQGGTPASATVSLVIYDYEGE